MKVRRQDQALQGPIHSNGVSSGPFPVKLHDSLLLSILLHACRHTSPRVLIGCMLACLLLPALPAAARVRTHASLYSVDCSVCGSRFNLPSYYSVIKPIGQGAYGIVCSATDRRTQRHVAIKKITDAFAHATDTKVPSAFTPICPCLYFRWQSFCKCVSLQVLALTYTQMHSER